MTAIHSSCAFCGAEGTVHGPADMAGSPGRRAFDPWRGRLWNVCARCGRWSPIPLSLRWETLEECEKAANERGRLRLTSENLSLIRVGDGELVRVGPAPRVELAGWRYGDRMPPAGRRRGLLRRLFGSLPPPPLTGYRPYGLGYADPPVEWVVSPFQDAAWGLTLAFTSVPLAPSCPACDRPVAVLPWSFHELRFARHDRTQSVLARCALCETDVAIPASQARPALRLGLSMLTRRAISTVRAEAAAEGIEDLGGAEPFVDHLVASSVPLGDMTDDERMGLAMALDDAAEVEALELEWREAEEIAAIMDGELTNVPGFEAFRSDVLARTSEPGF